MKKALLLGIIAVLGFFENASAQWFPLIRAENDTVKVGLPTLPTYIFNYVIPASVADSLAAHLALINTKVGIADSTGALEGSYRSGKAIKDSLAAHWGEINLKADDADVIKKDGSVAYTGDQSFGGNYVLDLQNISDLGGSKASYNFDGIDDYIQVADSAAIQNIFDGGGSLSAWIYPRSDGENDTGIVMQKRSVGGGYYIATTNESAGYIKITFLHGFSTANGTWVSANAIVPINAWSKIDVAFNSSSVSNNPTLYVNGVSITTTETVTPIGSANSDSGSNFYLGNNGLSLTATFDGLIADARLHNHELTAAEAKALYSGTETPYKYAGASQTPVYTSDFSSGTDGYIAANGAADGNIDGIGGQDNNLRYTTNTSLDYHRVRISLELIGVLAGEAYEVSFDYYITSGQSNLDNIRYYTSSGYSAAQDVTDAWTTVKYTDTRPATGADGISIYGYDGTDRLFEDVGGDDVFYIRNVVTKRLGEVAAYRPQDATPTTWYDASGNGNDGTGSGATLINAHDTGYFESGVAIGSDSKNLSGQITLIASDNDQMTIAANTSDQMAFAGASGGYAFGDGDVSIGGSGFNLVLGQTSGIKPASDNVSIYRGDASFTGSAGSLILQARGSAAGRMIQFVTGTTPAVRAVINDVGSVGIGTTAPLTILHQTKWSADAVGSYHTFSKSRHATAGSHTVVQDDDVIGGINFAPSDGTDFSTIAAQIKSSVDDASPAASSIGGDLTFSTAKGAGTDDLTLAATINKTQDMSLTGTMTSGSQALGRSGEYNWMASDGDAAKVAINTSDAVAFTGASGGWSFDYSVGVESHLYLALENDATTPTLNFGDDNDGIYSSADGKVDVATSGVHRLQVDDDKVSLDDVYLHHTASPGTDLTWSGNSATMTVGENVTFGQILYVKSDGKLWKADASAATTMPGLFLAGATISADASGFVIMPGSFVRNDAWTWTVGGAIYVDLTSGALTQTAPSSAGEQVQKVGYATHADRLFFYPSIDVGEI